MFINIALNDPGHIGFFSKNATEAYLGAIEEPQLSNNKGPIKRANNQWSRNVFHLCVHMATVFIPSLGL